METVGIAEAESEKVESGHSVHAESTKIHLYLKAASIYNRSFKVQRYWRMFINKFAETLIFTTLPSQESVWNASLTD